MSSARQHLYEVPWASGTVAGIRHVWAPDAATAERTLAENPAHFGLPHEACLVGAAEQLTFRHQNASDAFVL